MLQGELWLKAICRADLFLGQSREGTLLVLLVLNKGNNEEKRKNLNEAKDETKRQGCVLKTNVWWYNKRNPHAIQGHAICDPSI